MPHLRRFVPHLVVASAVAVAFAASTSIALAMALPDDDHYNSPGFIVRHAWMKFAYLAASPFRDGLSEAEREARVARFFELNGLIAENERVAGDPASARSDAEAAVIRAEELRHERGEIENGVEAILNGRLTEVIEEAGLTRRLGGADVVWPPVSIEFEDPPAVLVKSPRDEIRRDDESLLEGGLPIERVQELENDAERDGGTSALVVNTGGIAMYPAIVPQRSDYRGTLENIAHEWIHHYLYFTPLGRDYFQGGDLTTLNETLANIAGRELGDMMFERYPVGRSASREAAPTPQTSAEVDFVAEMRGLRREVEAMLARGEVEAAERLMEEKRRFLAENGHYIRRLNQAYFAFHGSYADSAGSIDPIGPKFQELRERSGSLEDFVRTAQEFRSAGELDEALGEPAVPTP